jgi:saccharopine dehydrogenase-like NADP-dependent oxidoreductase
MAHEYYGDTDCIFDGHRTKLRAIAAVSEFKLPGSLLRLSSANTVGGLGTLCDSLRGKVRFLIYQTIRHEGHWEAILRMQEAGIAEPEMAKVLGFEAYKMKPGEKDCVVMAISTEIGGRVIYIEPAHGLSAIQYATASGGCVVLDLMARGLLPKTGLLRQEDISAELFFSSPFSKPYQSFKDITHEASKADAGSSADEHQNCAIG